MQASKRTLLALAIAAALLPGLALADKPATTGQGKTSSASSVSRIPVTSESYRGQAAEKARADHAAEQAEAKASDQSAINLVAEDDVDEDDAGIEDTDDTDDIADNEDDEGEAVGGIDTSASTKSAAQTNPGKGNWWTDIDGDSDGRISRDEAKGNAGLDSRFSTVDADGDGFVTQEEYREFYTANASRGADNAADHSSVVTRDVWSTFDTDSDGKLSPLEIDLDARLKADFGSIDADGDGFVTDAEYRAFYRGQ